MILFSSDFGDDQLGTDDWKLTPGFEAAIARALPTKGVVGLIAPTGRVLVEAWQAALNLGHQPIILHYPTAKLSRVYWESEMASAVRTVGIDLLLCADGACVPDLEIPRILLDAVAAIPGAIGRHDLPMDGAIIQMSSGTTGFRKGIRFDMAAVHAHAEEYNKVLGLKPGDCVVSWLPLYHDMGFVAAFLLPRIIGCKLVLMDPIAWIRRPQMLWEAIDAHQGAVCYMPNFGFEVMASKPAPAPSMRKWISCSEPTRARTMERFCEATGTPGDKMFNCWGMAENIFAVAQTESLKTQIIDGVEVVSCGKPIPGVEVKIDDGEVLVRSAYSVQSYIGQDLQLDTEGFYRTGDLGAVIDGEIYLQGRRQDMINNAGRKTILSDIDDVVAQEVPEAAGRIAAFAQVDADLGTERPVILVEDAGFWRRNRDQDTVARVIRRTGLESAQAYFVPPRFITKTSSGKVNRKKTGEHWRKRALLAESGRGDASPVERARADLAELFPWLDTARPIKDQIDSLGFVNLALTLSKHGLGAGLDPANSVDSILRAEGDDGAGAKVVRIVSLIDTNPFRAIFHQALEEFVAQSPIDVQVKHVCSPPASILKSDLVFTDYFMTRDEGRLEVYQSLRRIHDEIRAADIILTDDASQLFWLTQYMVYPRISHDYRPHPYSPLLGVRWAGYSEANHEIAMDMIQGDDIALDTVNQSLADLGDYVGATVVRVAYSNEFAAQTADWEVQCGAVSTTVAASETFKLRDTPLDSVAIKRRLNAALRAACPETDPHRSRPEPEPAPRKGLVASLLSAFGRKNELAMVPAEPAPRTGYVDFNDQPHWCSWLIRKELIDFIVAHYRDILVLGRPGSVPYLRTAAAAVGARVTYRPDMTVSDDCDCVVQLGSWGKPETDKPIFQVMAAGWLGEPAINLPPELQAICPKGKIYEKVADLPVMTGLIPVSLESAPVD